MQIFYAPDRKVSSESQLYWLSIVSPSPNASSYYASVAYWLNIDYTMTIQLIGLPGKWSVWLSKFPVSA